MNKMSTLPETKLFVCTKITAFYEAVTVNSYTPEKTTKTDHINLHLKTGSILVTFTNSTCRQFETFKSILDRFCSFLM